MSPCQQHLHFGVTCSLSINVFSTKRFSGSPLTGACCPTAVLEYGYLHILCGTAVSPMEPYLTAQGAGETIYSFTHTTPKLFLGCKTFNVATVPDNPAYQGQQHQQNSCVHHQISKVSSLNLQRCKNPSQQTCSTKQIQEDSKHQGQLTVG